MSEIKDQVPSSLVDYLKEELGQPLRSVTIYDSKGFQDLFVRDDVFNEYSVEEEYELYHEWVMNSSSASLHEESFNAGEYRAQVQVFEAAVTILIPISETGGLFIAYDYSTNVSAVSLIENCLDHLNN